MTSQGDWYYLWAGRLHGPIAWGQLEELLGQGLRADRVVVARMGDARWMSPHEAGQVRLLSPEGPSDQLPPLFGLPARPRPRTVLEGFGYWLSLAWELLMADVWAFVLATLLMWLVSMATVGVLAPPMVLGVIIMGLRVYDGRPVRAADVFCGLSRFVPAWGLVIVLGGVIFLPVLAVVSFGAAIGYLADGAECAAFGAVIAWLCLLLPWLVYMFVVLIACLFCQPLIAEGRAGVFQSIGLSWRTVRPQFWGYLLIQLVLGLINSAGTEACYVGNLITWPYVSLATVALYREQFPAQAGPII